MNAPNATPQREHDWHLSAEHINRFQNASIERLVRLCKHAHYTNVKVRINGEWQEFEADWIKHMAPSSAESETAGTFQGRVAPWMEACFGSKIAADVVERNHRFLEEALELVQSKGCTADEAHRLVDYVFGRPLGEPHQEVGGVMVTLAALCLASGLDMHAAAEDELRRVWGKIDVIREKQRNKPKNSPLPEATALSAEARRIDYGSMWGFMRSVLTQGAAIYQDFAAGNLKDYEEYSARVDAAARERDDELKSLPSARGSTTDELDAALRMLAEWCVMVARNGTSWDDWDEGYKDAAYRDGPLRDKLDAKILEVCAQQYPPFEWPFKVNLAASDSGKADK